MPPLRLLQQGGEVHARRAWHVPFHDAGSLRRVMPLLELMKVGIHPLEERY